jgi:CMP/dCMP kinase
VSELIVAVDGPAGSGKSSVSRLVARRLRLPHLDTGGHYRAATLVALRRGIALDDGAAIVAALGDVEISSENGFATIDGQVVEGAIRGPDVTAAVSEVSAHPEVRRQLVELQREWVADHGGSGVVEGRDIGTVVFLDAGLKIFLTADETERARRRARERGEDPILHLEAIRRRDASDGSRLASPMTIADDAIVIDTTHLAITQVVDTIVSLAEALQL